MFNLIDKKFKKNKIKYLFQSLFATVSVFVILLSLDAVSNAAVIAALGASSFICFTMPHSKESQTRHVIGGYIIGIIVGFCCYYLSLLPAWSNFPYIVDHPNMFFCSIAVGLAIFLMVITDTEHPPATGMALGLILNKCELKSIVVVFIGISFLVILKTILKPYLKDLS